MGGASGGARRVSGGFGDEVCKGLGTLVRRQRLGVEQPPWAQADLSTFSPVLSLRASKRQSSDTTWSAGIREPALLTLCPPPPSRPALFPLRPSLPSSAGWAGTYRHCWEGGRVRSLVGGRGPSSREYDSPRPQNSFWTQARGPAWDEALRVG